MDWLVRNLAVTLVILGVAVCAFAGFRLTPNEVGAFTAQHISEAAQFTRETIVAWTSDSAEAAPITPMRETVTVTRESPVLRPVIPAHVPDTLFTGSQVVQAAFVARMEQERLAVEAMRPALPEEPAPGETILAGSSSMTIPLEQPDPQSQPQPQPELAPVPRTPAPFEPGNPLAVHPVALRMLAQLPPEIVTHFELFLYVSKADAGPWAQQMYVFDKDEGVGGMPRFTLLHQWFVSTGRETEEINARGELMSTSTPQGLFKLDPDRFYRRYWSSQWDQAMPWTMFFDYQNRGNMTGLAIHGTVPETLTELGSRASAGCIRLAPENAKTLYRLVRRNYAGYVPRFAIDRTGTMSSEGIILRNRKGNPRMEQGFKVIVFIDNFTGEDTVIATLY